MMNCNDNESIFRNVLAAAFEDRDTQAAVAFFTDDAVVVDYAEPAVTYSGRDAIRRLIDSFLEVLPDASCEILELISSNDRLAAEFVVRATPKGRSEPVVLHLCTYDVFREGQIVSEHLYRDSAQFPAEL